MFRRSATVLASVSLAASGLLVADISLSPSVPTVSAATSGPLHTTGTDTLIYDATGLPVRLIGFNLTGTEQGGRNDFLKAPDACGAMWRTPADPLGNLGLSYDNAYQVIRDWDYNVVRIPIAWHNLEPVAPVWDAAANKYAHTWNQAYLDDLKSMVSKAHANGLMVILDMHQDYWSPALHDITNWNGTQGYCEGVGMPRWLDPSIDAKASTMQTVDFYNGMNWFYRNVADPTSPLTLATPWQLFYSAWDQVSYQFSAASGFADHEAVIGADILNEPYISYVGGNPPAGQTVLQAAGTRLHAFYNALAPAITNHNPTWLLFFQDSTGGYNAANPAARETPTMTGKPTVPGNWVYSIHDYNFAYGTFADGVTRHDDFGITLVNAVLANAAAWGVPLYIGEFTTFGPGIDARQLTDADMAETNEFLSWARTNRVNWSFWAYVNPYLPMTVIDYTNNQSIPVVRRSLESGRDTPGNQPPIASFTTACSALTCSFDAGGSNDPDGTVVGFGWAFGDGTTGVGAATSHAYQSAGTYPVTLTVTDDDGAVASTTSTVTVASSALLASDTFSRVLANGWGTADLGGTWTTTSGAWRFAVTGGRGSITMATPTSGPSIFLNGVASTASDTQVAFAVDKPPTGGGVTVYLVGRRVVGAGDYRAKVRLQSTGRVGIGLVRVSPSGAETTLRAETLVTGLAYTAPASLTVRTQVVGTNPTTVRARVWRTGSAEPSSWTVVATDSSASLQAPGSVGIMSYLSGSATNAPNVARVDDLRVGPA